jgi:hypothetical protein
MLEGLGHARISGINKISRAWIRLSTMKNHSYKLINIIRYWVRLSRVKSDFHSDQRMGKIFHYNPFPYSIRKKKKIRLQFN